MSIEAVDNAESCEKARESQGRVNHSAHFYGSSIEQCNAVLPMNEVRDPQVIKIF